MRTFHIGGTASRRRGVRDQGQARRQGEVRHEPEGREERRRQTSCSTATARSRSARREGPRDRPLRGPARRRPARQGRQEVKAGAVLCRGTRTTCRSSRSSGHASATRTSSRARRCKRRARRRRARARSSSSTRATCTRRSSSRTTTATRSPSTRSREGVHRGRERRRSARHAARQDAARRSAGYAGHHRRSAARHRAVRGAPSEGPGGHGGDRRHGRARREEARQAHDHRQGRRWVSSASTSVPQGKHLRVHRATACAPARRWSTARSSRTTSCASGRGSVQDYLLREIQNVYRAQGVTIDDKHIEIIVGADDAQGAGRGSGRQRLPAGRRRRQVPLPRGENERLRKERKKPRPPRRCCSASPRPRCSRTRSSPRRPSRRPPRSSPRRRSRASATNWSASRRTSSSAPGADRHGLPHYHRTRVKKRRIESDRAPPDGRLSGRSSLDRRLIRELRRLDVNPRAGSPREGDPPVLRCPARMAGRTVLRCRSRPLLTIPGSSSRPACAATRERQKAHADDQSAHAQGRVVRSRVRSPRCSTPARRSAASACR
jgi:hypothetical protein